MPNVITHDYVARGGAARLFLCRDPEVLIEGPAGTGKSRAVVERIIQFCDEHPRCRVAVVRKTRKSLTESWMVTFENTLQENSLDQMLVEPLDVGPRRSHRDYYEFKNGSQVVLGGMDNPTRLYSTEFDMVYVNEATELTEHEWESLHRSLRNNRAPYQQLLGDCNPDAPTHWLNVRCNAGKTTRIVSRHSDNPTLKPAYLERLMALTGVRRARLYEGKWAAAEGIIYDGFDRLFHVVAPFDIPSDWTRYRSIDFGLVHPFVCQWWAVDGDGRMYLYRQWVKTGWTAARHAKKIVELTGNERIEATISDHSATDRATLMEAAGIDTVLADKQDKRAGIDAMTERLRKREDGKARLYVFDGSLVEPDPALLERHHPIDLVSEIDGYVWKTTTKGVKEDPIDLLNDSCDAARYMVMHLDARPSVVLGGWAGENVRPVDEDAMWRRW